ncbi:uncharacterized protein LOC110460803 [Mizuhopecten yessoensis]|uniref:uncharacterized protein LOC110460803 n=1 Tax=Mizuhopecten yessoensis TaxID=6573 RepID=UPI000B45F5EB|nr:uncharacterized protein LOC110460803 [Mizuhopecten yessoensis]
MLSCLERNAVITRREVTLLSHLAISEVYLEKHSNTERTVDRAMQIACRDTPHHPAIAVMLNTMGLMLENSGRSQINAMRYYKWSLDERRKHSYFRAETLCPALLNVSLQFVRSGNCNAALKTLEEAIELRKQYGWVDHFTGVTLYYIALVYMQIGNFSLALEYNQQALNMLEQCTPEHPVNLKAVNAIAHCYLAMNDELNARRFFDIAIAKHPNCKTIGTTHKICTLRHCLVLGGTHQRQIAYSCLEKELSEMPDTEMNIGQRISECMAIYSTEKGECWNWNDNGREL